MAGGTWVAQNKVRPGVYVNFVSDGGALGALGERGIAAMALSLPWGTSKQILTINAGDDVSELLGYDIAASQVLLVREALKRAKTLLLYRLNTGTKASKAIGTLTATAKYGGARGNDLTIIIQTNVDDNAKFDVITMLTGEEVDRQIVSAIADLTANAWVTWSGTGSLTTSAGAALTGGADGTTVNGDHTDFLSALELRDFQTVAYPGTDNTLKGVYAAFARRLRDTEGTKIQAVLENYPTADHEGVISVKNGVILSDGTTLTAAQATAWVAGATAAASIAESLTYRGYDDATDANPRYTNSQTIAALEAGEFLFTASGGKAIVEQDINSLTSFTPEKGKQFHKNRVIRVLDGIGNDFKRIFESFYLGKVNNNADGRNLLKAEIISYLTSLQAANAVQNFDSQTDVQVTIGTDSDSVYVELNVQPVDAIEKIYMKVKVK
ncbi:phage tail sheath family protein [Cohnella silvisoli]|uniref:Phage tail sheath family protein n=1 Tax=Cohnella silvisoli TaxID=2873699 RepID=A0ABV1L345_9BACL|nr:phage tail sheath family protein [Cohnella silvisoli]MCD9026048.1 phage tail sheath family protein [Cohnella silvisoli]